MIIIALFIGAEVGGVMGALLAVPFTVVLQVLFEQFYRFEEAPARWRSKRRRPSLYRKQCAPSRSGVKPSSLNTCFFS